MKKFQTMKAIIRGRGRPNMTCKRQVEEHTDQIGLKKEDAIDRTNRLDDIYKHEVNPATCVNAVKTGIKKVDFFFLSGILWNCL